MKFSLLGIVFMAAMPAAFATVTYTTVGSQLCFSGDGLCGTNTQQIDDVILTFNPLVTASVDPNPTSSGSYGEIQVSCFGGGSACLPEDVSDLRLYIFVDQSEPDADSDYLVAGVLSGLVGGEGSSGVITWAIPNTLLLGATPIAYSIPDNPLDIVPVTTNNGITSIQAEITIPEPATYLLLSAGLLGIGLRRRFFQR